MTPTELLARQREREQAARRDDECTVCGLPVSTWAHNSARSACPDCAAPSEHHTPVAARNDRALLLNVVEAANEVLTVGSVRPFREQKDDRLRAALDALFAAWEAE